MGANVNAKDYRSFTPLHYASKAGKVHNVSLLCENGANPNAQGHRLKTPLHKARLPAVVQILCDNYALPFAKALEKSSKCDQYELQNDTESTMCKCLQEVAEIEKEDKGWERVKERDKMLQGEESKQFKSTSVFNTLIGHSPNSTEVFMNTMIKHNGFEKDSKNYSIIYDLELFQKESLKREGRSDEMIAHSRILGLKSDILLHPLSAIMLILKWRYVSRIFWITGAQYALFVLLLSAVAIIQTNFERWFIPNPMNKTVHQDSFQHSVEHSFPDVLNESDDSLRNGFYAIYVFLALNTLILLVREIFQLVYNWSHYVTSMEDLMEGSMVILTASYLIAIFTCDSTVISHLAAWSVFLSWIEVILFLGRHPRIALYIHMFTSVLNILLKCILMYSPALIAFALSFHLLMPYNDVFLDPGSSFLKIFVMMLGENEYLDNFAPNSAYTSTQGRSSNGSTQLLFIIFLIAVSIIIVNLLVGLTIGELNVLKERARAIRLKKVATETLLILRPWMNENMFTKWIFFPTAKLFRTDYKDLSLFSHMRLNKDKNVKVCIYPAEQRGEWFPGLSISGGSDQQYNVYVYDQTERFCRIEEMKLIGTVPSSIVSRTQAILDEREEAQQNEKEKQEKLVEPPNRRNDKQPPSY